MGVWGFFITLEGIEASGKTTLARSLAEGLREAGYDVVSTREPGGTPVAEVIRRAIIEAHDIESWAEVFLFLASRRENTYRVILPALRQGKVVVCERYTESTFAYQCAGRGLPQKPVSRINKLATGGLVPNLTFLLDIDPEMALRRRGPGDRFESMGLDFHQRVREGYLRLARRASKRIVVLDATRPPEELAREALGVALRRIEEKKRK